MLSQARRVVASRATRRSSCQPQIEELETRLVLNAKVSLSHGLLKVVLDNKPATVTLRQSGKNTIVNKTRVPTRKISSIQILGGASHDTIVTQDTPAGKPVSINSGGGNDVLRVGNAANQMNSIQGSLTFDGDAGVDSLML